MQALEGIKVIDLSRYGPGRYCSLALANFGADVITVEMPRSGSGLSDQFTDDTSSRYLALNHNKRSMALNIKQAEGKAILYRLIETADVILEGFRPGVVKRLGVDYTSTATINPRIVYCSLSGFGQDGPYVNIPGHDINYLAIGGILGMTGHRGGPPEMLGTQVADLGGTAQAIIGILIALLARERTGKGQYIDISILDNVVSWLALAGSQYLMDSMIPRRGETPLTGAWPCYNIYETKGGAYLSLGVVEPQFWENLCHVLGREDFIPHQNATGEKREEIFEFLRKTFLTKTVEEWVAILRKAEVLCGPVNDFKQVFSDPQVLHRKMVVEAEHSVLGKVKLLGIPIKLSDTPGQIRLPPPRYGEHTEHVLRQLGYNDKTIKDLRSKGIIE